ncbi:MAG: class I SAM-dependent methyltransferase [Kofleriaceae bacterium]|nr:class I SAM-dependent methyltransferase [Kofleriaceae bacterium]MBP6836367.1 class I SAM-dependent methyltransferase [Kofleriaceae bacterium]MBP9204384.1 class I SAM-dependent methyltransferase [Kofleriaceae bacterium]
MRLITRWIDARYRRPFVGASARRYAWAERPAFTDVDQRLLADIHARHGTRLGQVRCVVDLGAGPGTTAAAAAAAWPAATVIAIEPSPDFAPVAGVDWRRARAEALPIGDGEVDLVLSVSAIRHVADRAAAFAELRRVVRPGGLIVLAELDPDADPVRVHRHRDALRGWCTRRLFAPLVVGTAPARSEVLAEARAAGLALVGSRDDRDQPLYVLELARPDGGGAAEARS